MSQYAEEEVAHEHSFDQCGMVLAMPEEHLVQVHAVIRI